MATSSSAPFNSIFGYTVGLPPISLFAANGFLTTPGANIGVLTATIANITSNLVASNLTLTGTLTLPPNAIISGSQISGNIRAPGADTQIMFNIGGNLAADPDFTWNPVTNFLHVNGNACFEGNVIADYFSGDGANLTNVHANTANYVVMNAQPNITSVGNLTSLVVVGNSNLANAANIRIGGGNAGDVLTSYGNGAVYWSGNGGMIANGLSKVSIANYNGPVLVNVASTIYNANSNTTSVVSYNILAAYGSNTYVSNTYSSAPVIVANSEMWVSGNVRANHFDGDGSRLSNINAANIIGLPFISAAATVINNNQPNITSVGTLTSLNVGGVSNLGPVGNVIITGGSNGQVLVTNGAGNLSWQDVPQPNTIVDGSSNVIVYPSANVAISSAGVANVLVITSTGANLSGTANITGNVDIGGNMEVVGNAIVDSDLTVFGNANVDSNLTVSGVSNLGPVGNVIITGGTANQFLMTDGTGALSWQDIPIANLLENGASNVSIPVASGNIEFTVNGTTSVVITEDGIVSNTIVANTLSVGNLIVGNTTGNFAGYFTGNTYDTANAGYPGYVMGYRDVPQLVLGSNVTLTPAAAGKHYSSISATDLSITIPQNISNTFAMGTEIQIINRGIGNIEILRQNFLVELYKAGNNVSADRKVTSFGMATLLKVDTDTWMIQGTGII